MKPDMESLNEQVKILEQIRQELGEEALHNAADMRLRQTMVDEYKTITCNALQLIRFITKAGLTSDLTPEQRAEHNAIMIEITESARRCENLVEESSRIDSETLLASITPSTPALH